MESYLFTNVEAAADTLVVEGWHKPGTLTRSSGAWIHAAGTAMFEKGAFPLSHHDQWIWFAVEEGEATLHWEDTVLPLKAQDTCFLPAGEHHAHVEVPEQSRLLCLCTLPFLFPAVHIVYGAGTLLGLLTAEKKENAHA